MDEVKTVKRIEVVATERGYWGRMYNKGDKFTVPEVETGTWFTPVTPEPPKSTAKTAKS